MDAISRMVIVGSAEALTLWDAAALEATARDLLDVGLWEAAENEEHARRTQETERTKALREIAESEMRLSRSLLCAALEHQKMLQQLIGYARGVFQQAQEQWDRLELAAWPVPVPVPVPIPGTAATADD